RHRGRRRRHRGRRPAPGPARSRPQPASGAAEKILTRAGREPQDRRSPLMTWVRWIAVIPAAVAAWYAALFLGLLLLPPIGSFCPKDDIVSGMCVAWWYPYAERTVIVSCVGLSALFVVLVAAAVAPAYRTRVAWVAYCAGFLVAVNFAWQTGAVAEFVAAVLPGPLAALSGSRRVARGDAP